jgi:hypothetical protein
MAVRFSSASTVQVPRLLLALAVVVLIAGSVSFAVSGEPSVSLILPAAVVFGMGLYFSGARRYDVMDDRIRTVGIIGQRELFFEKIRAFEDTPPESFAAWWQSVVTGAPASSFIEVRADQSFLSGPNYLLVRDREALLRAAREALAAWAVARTSPSSAPNQPQRQG